MDNVKPIKATAKLPDLDPEQAELVSELRGLLDRALSGGVIGVFGLAVLADTEETEPVIIGALWSQGDTYMGLHNVADMVRITHIEDMLGIDSDSEE